MSGADLHVHTLEGSSEGDPATEVVKAAQERRLEAIAITDHSSVAGIEAAKKAALETKVSVIPGVELDAILYGRRCHVLCLFCPYEQTEFRETLVEKFEKPRNERVLGMVDRLTGRALISEDEGERLKDELRATAGSISTESLVHMSIQLFSGADNPFGERVRTLMQSEDTYDAWSKLMRTYFHPLAPDELNCHVGYEQSRHVSMEEAVRFATDFGGVAGLAHAGSDFEPRQIERAVRASRYAGARIIGVKHPKHTPEQTSKLAEIAFELGMISVGASDYHGRRSMHPIGMHTVRMETVERIRALSNH